MPKIDESKTEGLPTDAIHQWFGLSYASWLTMPRVLMESMPAVWQERMAELLKEFDSTFPQSEIDLGTRVQVTKNGKLVKTPKELGNYRRPDAEFIGRCRR